MNATMKRQSRLGALPPGHTDEAQAVGACVLAGAMNGGEVPSLTEADFSHPGQRVVWRAIRRLAELGGVSVEGVVADLAERGELEEAGGRAEVLALAAGVTAGPEAVTRLREWSAERRMVAACSEFVDTSARRSSLSLAERAKALVDGIDAARGSCGERAGSLVVLNGGKVEPREVEWLWDPYLPRGALSLLSGRSEAGKTWIALSIAAAITTGRGLLGQDGRPLPRRAPERVIYATAEDDVSRTLVPRLGWLGGDPDLVDFVAGRRGPRGEVIPVTFDDAAALERVVVEKGAGLLVLDPYSAFFGAGDMNSATDTRTRLALMTAMAERTNCAIMIIRHFKKGAADYALGRGQGSVDATAAARSELHAGEFGDAFCLAHAKASLAMKGASFGYRVAQAPDLGPRAGCLEWLGVVHAKADDLDPPVERGEKRTALEEAKEFLREELVAGPVATKALLERAAEAGIAHTTLKRAREELSIRSEKPHGIWTCSLPNRATPGRGGPLGPLEVNPSEPTDFQLGHLAPLKGVGGAGLAPLNREAP